MLCRCFIILLIGILQWAPVVVYANENAQQGDTHVERCERFASFEDIPEREIHKAYFGYIDIEQSLKPCLAAHEADPDNTRVQAQLARIYFQQGKFVEGLALAQLAVKDQPIAYVLLAHAYRKGVGGVAMDFAESIRLLEQAASHGVPDAMNDLSGHYAIGLGIPKDEQRALDLLQNSADFGDLWGKYLLGTVYLVGRLGQKTDFEKAITLLHTSANGGLPIAQYRLSLLVTSLEKKVTPGASEYLLLSKARFEKYARQGSASASAYLGEIYRRGLGAPKDADKAFRLYRQAANHRHVSAMRYLGTAYVDGIGTDKNLVEGKKWLELAATLGSTAARKKLETLGPGDVRVAVQDKPVTLQSQPTSSSTSKDHGSKAGDSDRQVSKVIGRPTAKSPRRVAVERDPENEPLGEVPEPVSRFPGGDFSDADDIGRGTGLVIDEPVMQSSPTIETAQEKTKPHQEKINPPETEEIDPITRFFSQIFQGEDIESEDDSDFDELAEEVASRAADSEDAESETGEEEIDPITRFFSHILEGEGGGLVEIEE